MSQVWIDILNNAQLGYRGPQRQSLKRSRADRDVPGTAEDCAEVEGSLQRSGCGRKKRIYGVFPRLKHRH